MQYNDFGKFIRLKRASLKAKVSLNKFAINNGIEPAALSRIERGLQGISLDTVSKIANGYGLAAFELLAEYEKFIRANSL